MIISFKYERNKKKQNRIHNNGTVFIAAKLNSINLSDTGIGLINLSIANGIASVLALGNEMFYGKSMKSYIDYSKQDERAQQNIKSFDEIYGNCLQGNLIDKENMNLYAKILTNT